MFGQMSNGIIPMIDFIETSLTFHNELFKNRNRNKKGLIKNPILAIFIINVSQKNKKLKEKVFLKPTLVNIKKIN